MVRRARRLGPRKFNRRSFRVGRFGLPTSSSKYYDATSTLTCNVAGALVQIAPIPQGSTMSTRVGDACFIKSIHLRIRLIHEATATAGAPQTIRFIVLTWLPDDAVSYPAMSDVLQTPADPASLYVANSADRARFVVHKDVQFSYCTQQNSARSFVINVPVNHTVMFNTAGVTGVGKLYLFALGTAASGGAEEATLTWYARTYFRD